MPELPEVETLKLGLEKYVVGHRILDVEIRVSKIFQGDKNKIIGAKIKGVKRIGKGLIIELDNKFCLAVHLKMTGQLIYRGSETRNIVLSKKTGGDLPSKYSHVIFKLKNQRSKPKNTNPSFVEASAGKQKSKIEKAEKPDSFLYFNDLRKFGWIKVVKRDEVEKLAFFKEMGPEPYRKTDLNRLVLTLEKLFELIKKSNLAIKVLLMDQKKIGGIGNIYANEALFKAGIDPRKKANQLTDNEVKKLYFSIIDVIKQGLKYGGSSDENFINVLGQEGAYQKHFLVYNRKGQKCIQCGGIIHKIKLRGRGTYYCQKCQK